MKDTAARGIRATQGTFSCVFVVSVNLFLVLSLERAKWKISVC